MGRMTEKGRSVGKATSTRKGKKKAEKNPEEENFSWIQELRYGQSISVEFFKKNAWLLLVIVVTILALMGLRYKTKTKMAEIKKLRIELQRAESEKLQEKAAYMSLIRETEMKRMVRERGLTLEFQEQPPYELTE